MKKIATIFLRISLPGILFCYILIVNDIGLVWTQVSGISAPTWIGTFILAAMLTFLAALRLKIVVRDVSLRTMLYVRFVSSAYGFVLPGTVAADGMRVYMLGKTEGKYSRYSAAVIVDKALGLITLLVLGVLGLLGTRSIESFALVIFFSVAALCLAAIFLVAKSPTSYNKISGILFGGQQKTSLAGKCFGFASRVLASLKEFANNVRVMLANLFFCVVFQICWALKGALLSHSVGAGFIFLDMLWIHVVLTLAFMLPLSFGGIGVREGTLIGLMGLIGLEPEKALAISFGFLAMQLVHVLAGFGLEIYVNGRRA